MDFAHPVRIKNLLAKINTNLLVEQILAEGSIEEPELRFIYLKKARNQKEFFRVLDKHLVPTKILQKFISSATKSESLEHIKMKFIEHLQLYIKVRSWLQSAYLVVFEKAKLRVIDC